MKSILSSVIVTLPLLCLTSASGTLQLDLKRDAGLSPVLFRKRQSSGTAQASLVEATDFRQYYVNVSIGVPPQYVQLILDTGSSDVWAIESNAFVNPAPLSEASRGSFDPKSSSNFNNTLPGAFNITYEDTSYALGDYFKDQFRIGGVAVENFQMGLALNTTNSIGIMGVGFNSSEATRDTYTNLVQTMVDQNLISTTAYSVWLNNLDAESGTILFGGIDTKKYTGTLSNIAMYPSQVTQKIDAMTVAFTSLSITTSSGTTVLTPKDFPPTAAVLDTGTTLTVLPDDLVQQLYAITGAVFDKQLGGAGIICSARGVSGDLSFGFAGPNGPVIKVPISQMIYPLILNGSAVPASLFFPHAKPDETICNFAITPYSALPLAGAPLLFGDSFVRSAYIVFDLANERIGMAQTNLNSTGSNVVAFDSQGAAIPSATTVSEVSLTYSVTGTAAITTLPSFTQSTGGVFSGSAGLAFSSVVAAGEAGASIASTTATKTGSPTSFQSGSATPTNNSKSAGSSPRPFACNQFILTEVVVGLFAIGCAVLM